MFAKNLVTLKLILFFVIFYLHAKPAKLYLVGSGLNVRFNQLLYTDGKYQALREKILKANTVGIMYHCRADKEACTKAIAKMRYKPSKHFYALAKAVISYIKSNSTAIPSGYVGTATFCHENTCIPDMDPPVVIGGCHELISCGGNKSWRLDPVVLHNKQKVNRYLQYK